MKRLLHLGLLIIAISFLIPACGGGGGGSSTTDSDTITTPATKISGVLALGTSAGNNRLARTIGNTQVQLIGVNGTILGLTQTDSNGAYSFSESLEASSYPLTIKAVANGTSYSSAIVNPETNIASNVNEITTAIATHFFENTNQS